MREVVGRKKMDSVLFESKQEIAEEVKKLMQEMLDRYHSGIQVLSVAIQNAQPPEQVQAAFNDAVKAGQDRERQINEGEAYANDVVPKARGLAERLRQEAEAYKSRVVSQAEGDANRFNQVYAQYEKAPKVTRDRMYVDTMQQIFNNTTKVMVDNKSSNNLLYCRWISWRNEPPRRRLRQLRPRLCSPLFLLHLLSRRIICPAEISRL